MRRMNLDETWKLCLAMWSWVIKQKKKGSRLSIHDLKIKWLAAHNLSGINLDCLFCEYDEKRSLQGSCKLCPAKKIDKNFHCANKGCRWGKEWFAFYKELRRLNKIRLEKKRKK